MCPLCLTTVTVVAASTTSGVGVLGLVAVKFRAWRRQRRDPQPKSTRSK